MTEGTAPEPAGAVDDEIARLRDDRDRLQSEVDGLRAELAAGRRGRDNRRRSIAAVGLVVVTSIVFTIAVAGVWARRNALNTDRWVETVGPLPEQPAVRQALQGWITTELMRVIDPEQLFESVLPERGQVLAAPLASAVSGFVRDEVDAFLASDTFQRLWVDVNRQAHARVVDVLEGDLPSSLQVDGDSVQLNLIPVLNRVLAEIGDKSPEIFGRTIDLPTITVDDVPQAAVEKLEDALGRDVPDDFGRFTVFDSGRLRQVQEAVSWFERLVVFAVVVAIALIAMTLWASPHRRRTLLQLVAGISLGVVLIRRLSLRASDDVVTFVRPENRSAARVTLDAFVSSLLDATEWMLWIAAAIAAVAVLTGPYRWAVATRQHAASLGRTAVTGARAAVTHRPDERTVAWVASREEALQLGGIVAGILALLVIDLSWLGVLLVLVVVGTVELAVQRIAALVPGDEPPATVVEPD